MQSKTTKVHPAPDENHYINAATRAAVSMTAKEETKENHQSSTNIHITQTGARTHTQQANGRAVQNQNLLAARILLRYTPVPGIIVDPMNCNETRTQLSEWITTGPSGSMTLFRGTMRSCAFSDYPPPTWIPVAAPVTFRREGLTLWSQVDRSVALGGGELTV